MEWPNKTTSRALNGNRQPRDSLAPMTEPTFFGIDSSRWDLLNGFANWFAAMGSFAAAAVALYLANRSSRPSAKVWVGHRLLIGGGFTKPYPEFVVFNIVNTGDRPIRVNSIGWKVGLFRKRHAMQNHDAAQSSPLPIELTHGQEASWYVPFSTKDEPWSDYFAAGMLMPHYRTALWTVRARFFTSVGYVFDTRPEESLLKPLRVACEKMAHSKT